MKMEQKHMAKASRHGGQGDDICYVYMAMSQKILQKITYLFYDGLEYRFKVLIGRVRQATKDVVKSNPQTTSPYIHNCNSLYTRIDHHMLLPIVIHMVVPLYFKQQ